MSPKERRLGGETGVKQRRFQVFPEGCDRGNISYLEGVEVKSQSRDFLLF